MNAIILCGGLSTRLGDITKTIPKVLLEIKGKTVLDWQLEQLRALGIDTVLLAAGHLSEVLRQEVGEERHGTRLVHIVEEKKLGTGGAIKHAMSQVLFPNDPTIILNGDILTNASLRDMVDALKHESDGCILGSRVDDAASYGTLEYDEAGHLKAFKEKEGKRIPGYINGGIYLFTPQIASYFPAEDVFSIEYDVFPFVKQLYVFESDDAWIDVGVPERLEWARENWSPEIL